MHTTRHHHAKILYRNLAIDFIPGGYFCRIPVSDIAIDADGAPDAYGPARFEGDEHGCGTDSLINAGYPTNRKDPIPDDWRNILVPDRINREKPFITDDGFYISKTSLYDHSIRNDRATGKFVDANVVSYIVMPQFWIDHLGIQLGDLCLLWHARLKRKTVAIVADTCPVDERLGEISIAAAKYLGGKNVSPRTGVDLPANGTVHCYIFKNSRPTLIWPLTNAFVQSFRTELEALLDRQS
ncbi:MAG: hypothetical protein ABIO86_19910 [Sphingomonas sp.]